LGVEEGVEGVGKGVIVWEEGVVEDVAERVAEVVVVEQKIGKRELIQRRKCQRRSDACPPESSVRRT
jgi:hypothetical protein